MGQDYSNMRGSTKYNHNTKVFDNISADMDRLVDVLTKARTRRMKRVLVTRNTLSGNNGHFPRSEKPRLNGHSFRDWKWKKLRPKRYGLVNNHRADDGYPYVRNLLYGEHWYYVVENGNWKRLTRGPGGGIFSTQMPNGIKPWLQDQKKRLENDIRKASAGKKLKDYR
jgi:hypothetical protein